MKTLKIFAISLLLIIGANEFMISYSAAQDKDEYITIGSILPMDFLYGWASYRGMQLAVDEINASGGVRVGDKNLPFRLVVMDSEDLEPVISVDEILSKTEAFINKEHPLFLVGGPCRSEAGVAMLDLASKYNIIHMLTSGVLTPAYHLKIAKDHDKYKYGFRITSSADVMSNDFLNIFKQIRDRFGLNKVYLMLQDVEHSIKGGDAMKKLFIENGFEVVGTRIYPTASTDYAIGLLESAEKDADILFIWMDMPESSILLKQWSDMKVNAIPIGFVCPAEQPNFYEFSEGKGEYLIVDLINGGNAPSHMTPWTMRFVDSYKKRWGIEPEGYGASSGYMAPYILKDAIERSGKLETDMLIEALEEADIMGVYGRVRFDKNSHQIISSLDPGEGAVTCIIQWKNGKRVQVYPSKAADGDIELPLWMSDKVKIKKGR